MNAQHGIARIAVIDNDSGFLRVLTRRFDAAGWEYRVHSSSVPPEELVAMKLNALILDPSVIGPLGWEFLERVCGMLPDLGVVVCTQGSTVAQRVRGLRLGADDWIAKPSHPEEVMARVEAVVRRRRRSRTREEQGPVVAGEIEIRADQFQAFVSGVSLELTRREFELAPGAGRGFGAGDRARGDLPARLGLRDGPRRPLGRRLRPQAARQAPASCRPEWEYIHTHFGVGYRFEPESLTGATAPIAPVAETDDQLAEPLPSRASPSSASRPAVRRPRPACFQASSHLFHHRRRPGPTSFASDAQRNRTNARRQTK